LETLAEITSLLMAFVIVFGVCLFIFVLWKLNKALSIWIDKNDKGL